MKHTMKSDLPLTWMWTVVIVLSAGACWAAPPTADQLWTCPQSPQTCLSNVGLTNECAVDSNCTAGERCCYRGCIRRCELPDPCDNVVCENGFTCLSEETPCASPPCQLEAVCKPNENIVPGCNSPACATDPCEPGEEHELDADGCPTCNCQAIPGCFPNILCLQSLICPLGLKTDGTGCPLCECKEETTNPCQDLSCNSGLVGGILGTRTCRMVQQDCTAIPCEPIAQCMSDTILGLGQENCNDYDPSTLGQPIVNSNGEDLDCELVPCPDRAVCVEINPLLGASSHKCCWQATQNSVTVPPKAGECPQEYMIDFSVQPTQCTIDANCPGEEKCCYRRLDLPPPTSYGLCMKPVHKIIEDAANECNRSPYLRIVFQYYGLC